MEAEYIPLGNLLGLVHYLPDLCPTGLQGVYNALCYLTQIPLRTRDHVAAVWPMCRTLVLAQHPQLNAVTVPVRQMRDGHWAYVWAWLDRTEDRLGRQLALHPASESDWVRQGYEYVPRAVNAEGKTLRLGFLDAEIQF